MSTPYNAPDFRTAGLSVSGGVEIDAYSSIARIAGIAGGAFPVGGFPAGVFFGNVLSITAPGTTWGWAGFAGDGLDYVLDVTNELSPFPTIVTEYNDSNPTAALSQVVTMPTDRQARDRIVIAMRIAVLNAGVSALVMPTDWAYMGGESSTNDGIGSIEVIELILDDDLANDPGDTLSITLSTSSALLAHVWHIRGSNPDLAGQCRSAQSTTSLSSRDVGILISPWREANSLWGAFVGYNNSSVTVTDFPDDFTIGQGQLQAAGTPAGNNLGIGYGAQQLRDDSLDATAWTFSASPRSAAIHWVVAPEVSGQLRLSAGSAIPAETFVANLFDYAEEARAWSLSDFAGTRLSISSAVSNGPFPEVVEPPGANTAIDVSNTTHNIVMPAIEPGQAALLVISHGGTSSVSSTPNERPWQALGNGLGTSHRMTVYYLAPADVTQSVADQTDPIVINLSASNAICTRIVFINDAHQTQLPTVSAFSLQNSTGATTNDIASVTPVPGDGSTEANYLYLSFLSAATEDSVVSAFPTNYVGTGQFSVASGTGNIDNLLAYCHRQIRGSSEDIGAYTYAGSGNGRTIGVNIAIIPPSVATLNWDGLGTRVNGSLIGTRRNINALSTTSIVAAGTDDTANDEVEISFQREALTGAITAALNSNTTAFGTAAAKSVLANATNATAVPAYLAGSAAFQYLRVNSANTALEWAVLDLAAFPVIAADTVLANVTGSPAVPTAHPLTTLFGTGLTYASGVGTWNGLTIRKNTGADVGTRRRVNLIEGSNVTITVVDDAGDGEVDVTFASIAAHTIRDNGTDETQRAALNFISTSSVVAVVTDDAANNESEVTMERAALTGAITAPQNSNTTTFGTAAAKSVLVNATNASAVPAFLAGAAVFQYLRVNSANTALEWATLSTHASTSVPYASDTFMRAALTGAISAATNSNSTLFAGIRNNDAARADRTNLNFLNSTSVTFSVTDDSANDELEITAQRAALTGAISAGANVNDTLFAGIRLNNAGQTARGNINLVNTPTIVPSIADDAANNEQEWSFTVQDDSIDNTKASNMAANTIKANPTASSADPTDMSVGTNTVVGRVAGNIVAAQLVTNQIANNQVTNAKFRQSSALSVVARGVNSTGDVADIQAGANDRVFRRVSDVLDWGVLTAGMFPANIISNTMIRDCAAHTVIGNATEFTDDPTDLFQPDLARVLNSPSTSSLAHTICWEDEDFKLSIDGDGGTVNVSVASHVNIFQSTTGVNGKWFATAGGSTGTFAGQTTDPVGHNGVLIVSNGSANGDAMVLYHARDGYSSVGGGGNGEVNFDFDDFEGFDFYLMLPTVTSVQVRVGVGTNLTSAGFGTDSCYFELDAPTDTTWHVVTRAASTSTDTDTGFTAVAGSWVKLSAFRSGSTIEFYINNNDEASHSTNIPTANMYAGVRILNNSASARSFHIDRVRIFMDDQAMIG